MKQILITILLSLILLPGYATNIDGKRIRDAALSIFFYLFTFAA